MFINKIKYIVLFLILNYSYSYSFCNKSQNFINDTTIYNNFFDISYNWLNFNFSKGFHATLDGQYSVFVNDSIICRRNFDKQNSTVYIDTFFIKINVLKSLTLVNNQITELIYTNSSRKDLDYPQVKVVYDSLNNIIQYSQFYFTVDKTDYFYRLMKDLFVYYDDNVYSKRYIGEVKNFDGENFKIISISDSEVFEVYPDGKIKICSIKFSPEISVKLYFSEKGKITDLIYLSDGEIIDEIKCLHSNTKMKQKKRYSRTRTLTTKRNPKN